MSVHGALHLREGGGSQMFQDMARKMQMAAGAINQELP
jgi:hypothetical protein